MAHRTSINVRFYELDPYRHLNHSVYVQYFEVGRIDMFASYGWTLTGLADMGVNVVVSEITTRFLRPGVEGDELVVETEVAEVKRVSARFGQRILRGDEVLATQTVTAACVSLEGRLMRFPDDMYSSMVEDMS